MIETHLIVATTILNSRSQDAKGEYQKEKLLFEDRSMAVDWFDAETRLRVDDQGSVA